MTDAESSTVARAIRVLVELSQTPLGLGISELALRVGTQRAPLYRIMRTLENARLVRRDDNKLYHVSFGLVPLAAAAAEPLEVIVRPILARLADETDCTAMLLLEVGDDIVTALCVTPSNAGIHITTSPGFVHPKGRVASRIAIESALPARTDDPDDVVEARRLGYATSTTQSAQGRFGMAAPADLSALGEKGCVLLLTLDSVEPEALAQPLFNAVDALTAQLGR